LKRQRYKKGGGGDLKKIRAKQKKLEAKIFKHNQRKIQRKGSSNNFILDHEKRMVQAHVYRSVQFKRRNWVRTFWVGNSETTGIMRGAEKIPPPQNVIPYMHYNIEGRGKKHFQLINGYTRK